MKYIILGIIQGLTEFLPVSSSGHLVLIHKFLNLQGPQLLVIATCHLGTVLALIIFFFKDIVKIFKQPKLIGYILWVTLITGIIGIAGQNFFESLFSSLKIVSFALLFTGLVLIMTKKFLQGQREINSLNLKDASTLGLLQAFSIIPGISRSGMTISGMLFRGLNREAAFKFSFLAGIPAILGAFLLEARYLSVDASFPFINLVLCFVFSFLSGLFALLVLKHLLIRARFHYFGYYCIFVGLASFFL